MDLNFKWAEKQSRGRVPAQDGAIARISVNRNGTQKGEERRSLNIVIYEKMIDITRLIAGDLVEIGFDKTARLIAVKRTKSDNGYKLSRMGKTLRTQISDTAYPFIHETIYIKKEHFFEQEGMFIFNLNSFSVKIK